MTVATALSDKHRVSGDAVDRQCPMCGGRGMVVEYLYERQPPGEFKFDFVSDDYRRELHGCRRCGHLLEWINADPGELYSGDYVSKVWGDRAAIHRTFERINALPPEASDNTGRVACIQSFLRSIWPAGRLDNGPRLLDVGLGLGVFPYRMKQAGWTCVGVDLDETLIAHARDDVGLDARVADVTKLDGLESFDLVTFNKVLEHIEEPVSVLASVKRLLRPDGVVYVELPDGEAAAAEGQNREEFLLGHVHVFSFASYALLLRRAGFELMACHRVREPSTKFTLRGFARVGAAGRRF